MSIVEIACVLGSYVLGGFCAAYYVVKLTGRGDVRATGSGTAGATNAGRVLGRAGFLGVFALDFVKGALPIGASRLAELGAWAVGCAMVAVVLGHVLPLQLGFQGGKGVSTAMGALLAYDAVAAFVVAGAFVPVFLVLRRFTHSGIVALAVTPLALLLWRGPQPEIGFIAVLVGVVLAAHHEDLRALFRGGSGTPAAQEGVE